MPRSIRPGHHRAAPGDREHVLDRHQKRPVHRPLRLRNVGVHRGHQLQHRLLAQPGVVLALQRIQRRALDHRNVVARKLVLREQLAHLQLDQLQQLRIVHLVDLVQIHHQCRHPDLARQENVLARLRHRPVGRAHHQDRAVHLRRPGDHVLDVVGVPRAVDVRIVALFGLVLDVRRVDRDAARLLLRRLVDLVVADVGRPAGLRQYLGDRRRQRRLAVVHVPDRPHVRVRLRPLKFRLRHRFAFLDCRGAGAFTRAMERVMGIEPTPPAWKAGALPLSYTRIATPEARPRPNRPRLACLVRDRSMVEGVGFEPTYAYAGRFTVCCL